MITTQVMRFNRNGLVTIKMPRGCHMCAYMCMCTIYSANGIINTYNTTFNVMYIYNITYIYDSHPIYHGLLLPVGIGTTTILASCDLYLMMMPFPSCAKSLKHLKCGAEH